MKKIAILIPIITLLSCGHQIITNKIAGWKTLTHGRYSIRYPPSWTVRDMYMYGSIPDFILSDPNNEQSVSLIKQVASQKPFTLDIFMEEYSLGPRNSKPNRYIVSNKRQKNKNGEYQQIITSTEESSPVFNEQRVWIINDSIYLLACAYYKKRGVKDSLIGEQILNSFTVKQ